MRTLTRVATISSGALLGAATLVVMAAPAAYAASVDCATNQAVTSDSYVIHHLNGTTDGPRPNIWGVVRPGDTIVGTLTISPECSSVVLSAASYTAPSAVFSVENQKQQVLFDSATTTANGGSTVVLTITVPQFAGGVDTSSCPNKHLTSSKTTNGNGSIDGNNYASTCDGRPSGNGNGNGMSTGKPCAGCVGNADNKNPPGQFPDGTDHNAGYECDRNHGIGRTNPAHTGCLPAAHFQIDFVVGPVIEQFFANGTYTPYPYDSIVHTGSVLG
jgi:hypothetical protein